MSYIKGIVYQPHLNWSFLSTERDEERMPGDGIEVEPHAKRYNQGKPRLGLIPPQIIEGLGYVLAFGAEKYDENNWKKGLSDESCLSSCLRHLMSYQRGGVYDNESGIHHLAHAACNLAFMLYFNEERGGGLRRDENS